MRYFLAILVTLVLATLAQAQTDFVLDPISGVYTVKAQIGPDAETLQIVEFCVVRVDLAEVIEYGCVPATENQIVSMPVTIVVTPDDNAELRGYVIGVTSEGLEISSSYSPNAAIIIFVRPPPPTLVP